MITPHVLIFPLPLQGPVNSNLKLAELLCISGIHVTFLNSQHIQHRLLRHTDIVSRFSRYPNFQFETISDSLSEDNPRTAHQFDEVTAGIETVAAPLFREMLTSGCLSQRADRPVTCIIADGIFNFVLDIAQEIGVPLYFFETLSPCCIWTYMCFPKLIESGELPFKGNDLDLKITCVPGMETFLRRRDLPGLCRDEDPANHSPQFQVALKEVEQIPRVKGLILNTFEELDVVVLSKIRSLCPNSFAIGPLHTHLKTRLATETLSVEQPTTNSNSLWDEDRRCMSWLDLQPLKTVIYVSFGSLSTMTWDQLMEFWHGLVNSASNFLWVQRPGSILEKDMEREIPEELLKGTEKRGCIVSWAPQEDVLAHRAIGGFLTHSGWNSTLESIAEGVPMICWPQYADQQVISRFVSEVWKNGIDMKDSCDRVVIEKMVKDLMELRRGNFVQSADMMGKLGEESVSEGGSSYCGLKRLIDDINSTSSS